MTEQYLGDGLYAKDDGYQIELWCDRDNGKNWVALEPEVMLSFFKFIEKSRGLKMTLTKRLDRIQEIEER